MAWELERKELAESAARLVSYGSNPLTGDIELVRFWPVGADKLIASAEAFLDRYTTAAADPATVASQHYVDNPLAGAPSAKPFPGRWRPVTDARGKRRQAEGEQGVYQTLRLGYITSLVSGTVPALSWDSARIGQDGISHAPTDGVNGTEDWISVRWVNVSPFHAETIVQSINGLTHNTFAPVIKGEAYGTGFTRLYCTHSIAEDGSAVITLLLAKPRVSITAFSGWMTSKRRDMTYHWNVPKFIAQAVIDAEKGVGKSVNPSYNKDSKTFDIVVEAKSIIPSVRMNVLDATACSFYEWDSFYRGVGDPTLYPVPAPANGWTYRRTEDDNGDGTYDVRINSRQTRYRPIPQRLAEASTLDRTYVYEQLGVVDQAIPDITNPPQGVMYDQTYEVREDCSKDVKTASQVSVPAAVYFAARRTPFLRVDVATYAASRSQLDAPAPTSGVYDVQQNLAKDGTYSGDVTYKVGTNQGQAEFASTRSGLQDEDSVLYRKRTTPVVAPESGQRGIYQVSNNLDDEGLYDGNGTYRVSKAATVGFVSRRSKFLDASTVFYKNADRPVDAPRPNAGLYTASNQMNQDKTYDGDITYQVGDNSGVALFSSQRSGLAAEDSAVYKSITAPVEAPESGIGGVYRASNQLDDDGFYNSGLQYQTERAAGMEFLSAQAPSSYETTRVYRNNNGLIVAPAAVPGSVYSMRTTIRDTKLYDVDVGLKVSVPDTVYVVSRASATLLEAKTMYRSSRAPLEVPLRPARGVYSVQSTENEDHTYSGDITYQVPQATVAPVASMRTGLSVEDGAIYQGQLDPVVAPACGQGGLYRANNNLTDAGVYDGSLTYQASVEAQAAIAASSSPTDRSDSLIYKNSMAAPQAPAPGRGGVYQVNASMNADKTYDGTLVYEVPIPFGMVFSASRGALDSQASALYQARETRLDAPTGHVYGIYRATNRIRRDGLYDGDLTYDLGRPFAMYYAWQTRYGVAMDYLYVNQTELPSSLIGSLNNLRNNAVSFQPGPDGLLTGSVTSRPAGADGGEGWDSFTHAFYRTDLKLRASFKRWFTMYVCVKQTLVHTQAYGFLPAGNIPEIYKADVDVIGGTKYRAFYELCLYDSGWVAG